jgi:hypothetical protein
VREALSKPDTHRLARVTRARKTEPCPPPHRRHRPQRLDDPGVDPSPFQRVQQPAELDLPVEIEIEVLQRTSAASPEVPTGRRGTPEAFTRKLDDMGFQSAAAAGDPPPRRAPSRARTWSPGTVNGRKTGSPRHRATPSPAAPMRSTDNSTSSPSHRRIAIESLRDAGGAGK